jgi:hypothetical protein
VTYPEGVVHRPGHVLEEFASIRVIARFGRVIEGIEDGLQLICRNAHLCGERLSAGEVLHQPATCVVLAMPLNFFAAFAVENEAEGRFIVFPHAARHIVPSAQLIAESVALAIEQQTTDTAQSLSGQKLDLCVRLVGVDQTRRVHLNVLQILCITYTEAQAHRGSGQSRCRARVC